jgi:hypothetical protein
MTVYETTKGTVTELEEVEPGGDYKIIDESVIDEKDTLSLKKMKNPADSSTHRHSGLRGILMYSMARSFFSNNINSVTPDSRYYKNPETYNKAVGVRNDLQRTASSRTMKVPSGASKGYGSGKSFRSCGG